MEELITGYKTTGYEKFDNRNSTDRVEGYNARKPAVLKAFHFPVIHIDNGDWNPRYLMAGVAQTRAIPT